MFLNRISNEEFEKLEPKDLIGWPVYFTVLPTGQIKIWPGLDTAQVVIKVHLT